MGRSPCCVNDGMNRGAWTAVEDQILRDYINTHGEGKWRRIPSEAGLRRCGKSCRLRWLNYLRPDIKRGNITEEEEDIIIRLHRLLGNRWSLIAGRIPGRTDNEIKNYWNTTLAKKVMMINQASPTIEINNKETNSTKKKTKSLTKVLDSIAAVRNRSTRPVRCNSRAVVNSEEDNTTTTTSTSEDLVFNVLSENIPNSSVDDYWELCQLDEAGLEDMYGGGSDDISNLYKWSSSASSEPVLFSEEMFQDWMREDYFHH